MEYKLINTAYLETVAGGDKSILSEIVDLFREQVAEISVQMKDLLAAGDFHQLGMLAHKAKSSVAIMGMENLAVMLKTFELEAKEGKEPEKYGHYVKRFSDETAAAVAELDDFIGNLPGQK